MPDRYWVGTGNWDSSNTANWRTTSGGATTAAVPTNADDVYFDANSTAGTCTVVGTRPCQNINFRGLSGSSDYTGTFTLPAATSIAIGSSTNTGGNITLSSAMSFGAGSTGTFIKQASTSTFTSNNKIFPGSITILGPGGAITNFADNWTIQGTFTSDTSQTKNIRSSVSGTPRIINVGSLNGGSLCTGTLTEIFFKMITTGTLSGGFSACNIEIVSPLGTITQNGLGLTNCNFTWTLGNYISTAGVGTAGAAGTFNNVSSINFHSLSGSGAGGQTITLNSNMNVLNNLTLTGALGDYNINGPSSTLFVGGDIIGSVYNFAGTASIQMNGATSAFISRTTTGAFSIANNLAINKSGAATVTISPTVTALGWGATGRTLTAASSTQFNPGTSTVSIPNNTSVSISENISFWNFSPGTTTTINII